jgi:hypothetical protein
MMFYSAFLTTKQLFEGSGCPSPRDISHPRSRRAKLLRNNFPTGFSSGLSFDTLSERVCERIRACPLSSVLKANKCAKRAHIGAGYLYEVVKYMGSSLAFQEG